MSQKHIIAPRQRNDNPQRPVLLALILVIGLLASEGYSEDPSDPMSKLSPPDPRFVTIERVFGESTSAELTKALLLGDREKAEQLIEDGADINKPGFRDMRPLYLVCAYNNLEAAKLAIDLGAKIDCSTEHHNTPIYAAMIKDTHPEIIKLLISSGADIDWHSEQCKLAKGASLGRLLLFPVLPRCELEKSDLYYWYLDHGGVIDELSANGSPVLTDAYGTRCFQLTHQLLERGANPHLGVRPLINMLDTGYLTSPKNDEERLWHAKIVEKVNSVRDNKQMIAEATKRMEDHAEFLKKYEKTEHYKSWQIQKSGIDRIVEGLKDELKTREKQEPDD